jgi:hypothetical protein
MLNCRKYTLRTFTLKIFTTNTIVCLSIYLSIYRFVQYQLNIITIS